MRTTWVEASLAFVPILMRTYTNAFVIKSFKWDYFWAMLALVGKVLITISKEDNNHAGHWLDFPGHHNGIRHFGAR